MDKAVYITDLATAQVICSVFDCVVSISDEIAQHFCEGTRKTYRYQFWDTLSTDGGGPSEGLIQQMHEDFKNLLADTEIESVLFHCLAGKSRSTAAAMMLFLMADKTPEQAWNLVTKVRPYADPNPLMLRLIDKQLDMNGTLIGWRNKLVVKESYWIDHGGWTPQADLA